MRKELLEIKYVMKMHTFVSYFGVFSLQATYANIRVFKYRRNNFMEEHPGPQNTEV